MSVLELDPHQPRLMRLRRFGDARGFFAEIFRAADHPGVAFVQDNISLSADPGTIRGLHFQAPPMAQAKLVTVLKGAVFDVAIDLRRGSPKFGTIETFELAADRMDQLLVPAGFAHGLCTLVPDTLVHYKVDAYYSAAHDRGILWNDPALGIPWPVAAADAILSDKDRRLPLLSEIETPFAYHADHNQAGARA